MTTRAKEKLIRDWEYMEREVKKLEGGEWHHIQVNKASYKSGRIARTYYVSIGDVKSGFRCTTPRKAIAALRRAVEGK